MTFKNFILIFLFFLVACRPTKKITTIQDVISKKDTTEVIVIEEQKPVDSASIVKDILIKLNKNKIEYNSFSAKIKVSYETKDASDNATAHIRLLKDQVLWISLTGALGVEGFRIYITKDSIVLMDKIKKTVQYRSISYVQELTQLPFDFSTMQDVIVGNPVFLDSNVMSFKSNPETNELLVLTMGNIFKHLVTLDFNDFKLKHSKLDDLDPLKSRTCDISLFDYELTNQFYFSTKRIITVSEKSKLDIDLEYKQYAFNQPLTFPFNIPKNYKIK